jgi:hypothetical protein
LDLGVKIDEIKGAKNFMSRITRISNNKFKETSLRISNPSWYFSRRRRDGKRIQLEFISECGEVQPRARGPRNKDPMSTRRWWRGERRIQQRRRRGPGNGARAARPQEWRHRGGRYRLRSAQRRGTSTSMMQTCQLGRRLRRAMLHVSTVAAEVVVVGVGVVGRR